MLRVVDEAMRLRKIKVRYVEHLNKDLANPIGTILLFAARVHLANGKKNGDIESVDKAQVESKAATGLYALSGKCRQSRKRQNGRQ